jgi:hypothetical protein
MIKAEVEMLFKVKQDYKGVLYRTDLVLKILGERGWAYEYKGLVLHAQGKIREARETLERAKACYRWQEQPEEADRIQEILDNLEP